MAQRSGKVSGALPAGQTVTDAARARPDTRRLALPGGLGRQGPDCYWRPLCL